MQTFPVGHAVEEHPRCIWSRAALNKRNVVTGLDADDRKQFHLLPRALQTQIAIRLVFLDEANEAFV